MCFPQSCIFSVLGYTGYGLFQISPKTQGYLYTWLYHASYSLGKIIFLVQSFTKVYRQFLFGQFCSEYRPTVFLYLNIFHSTRNWPNTHLSA